MSSIDLCSILTMEDIFSRLLNLTSYMNQTFIRFIEDVMFRDMSRWFEDSEVIFCGFGCNERGDSVLEDRPFIDSRLQIVNTSSNYGGVRFVFKGINIREGGSNRRLTIPEVDPLSNQEARKY
ncbi:uncharacterized protein [Henckelia pumila]|uniref:uncharacterized protein isoform X4 n=1 Tax=Henckelia pumila TaxID=405737 RepID=UPI003C6DC556